jgi:DNA-directed RNA polymerase subunit omega
MINPSLDVLMKRADCKYTLVAVAAKRAREIKNGETPLVNCQSKKSVTIALEEIAQKRIGYYRVKDGIK